jgi:electron transfer flavoprotein alpha/beta subunit
VEIVVCIKPVPEAESRLRVAPDGRTLDPEGVKFVLAGYDESAIEQALLLKEASPGSKVHVVAYGPAPRTEEVLRAAVALGADLATWVEGPPGVGGDPITAARALAGAIAATLDDPAQTHRVAAAVRTRVRSEFSSTTMVEAGLAAYREALAMRKLAQFT